MSPQVSQALYVEGVAVGAAWQFTGRCFVEDPPQSGNWRKATSGEVEVILDYLGEWWQPTQELERKNTNASGDVSFAGTHASGSYTMEAKHIQSGDRYKVRVECHDDGTYDVSVEIE
ncbi:unnamed protein product [marine sediment metagenome]|uniref:Uncharacterized protein n=1 Tax=marine sediment metagenome TaxID=412755 RepID=X1SJ20_9ZZZZ